MLRRCNVLPGYVVPKAAVAFAQPPLLDPLAECYVRKHLATEKGLLLPLYDL
jgi:hypothetical protein